MQSVFQLPIGKEDEFKGIIDLFEMKAYIYNDDKGDDISITDIPEDMQDDAELYRTELIEKICELDDDLMMEYLEGEEPSVEELKSRSKKSYMRMYSRSGMLRYRLQKQRRSEAS